MTCWCCILRWTRTFLRAWLALRPQPRPSVFITSVSAYSRLVKHWFSQLSPAGHTWQQQHKRQQVNKFIQKISKNNSDWYAHKPVGDTRTAACGWDTGNQDCKDAHLSVYSCIVGFLTGQLRASALSPLVCWTGTRNKTHTESKIPEDFLNIMSLFVLREILKWRYLDTFVWWRFARVAFLL